MGIWKIKNKELINLIVGRKGGKTTTKIIDQILTKPYNINQLSNMLNLDYKTITYHIEIIYEHKYVEKEEFKNCTLYYPSKKLFNCLDEYKLIKEFIENE
ncbi:hypothetical protein TL18_07765 [Methanobrevibacter sp. YE315]|nr:hypothetical protein TL18_07765 [Methanobrevibacter sp. YE315]